MNKVTSVEDILLMCSEAIDDLIRESPLDDKNSINIVCEGFTRLNQMTKDVEDMRNHTRIAKTPIANYIAGGVCPLLVKCIANLHILLSRSYTYDGRPIRITKDLLLDNLLELFLNIVESPDGHKHLTNAGLKEAIAGLPKELKSDKEITAIYTRMTIPNAAGGRRRSKKHKRSKKTKTRRSRK